MLHGAYLAQHNMPAWKCGPFSITPWRASHPCHARCPPQISQQYELALPLVEARVELDRATVPPNNMERIYNLSLLTKCLVLRDGPDVAGASPRCVDGGL